MKKINKVLFICFANIARSQMAEAFYNHYTKSKNGMSAGVADFKEKYNHVPHKGVVEVMKERNISMDGQYVKVVTKELVDEADEIIVFCDIDKCPELVRNNTKTTHMPLIDPGANIQGPDDYNSDIIDGLRSSRNEIEKIVLKIIKN